MKAGNYVSGAEQLIFIIALSDLRDPYLLTAPFKMREKMRSKLVKAFIVSAMTVGVATIVHAQQNGAATRVDAGKYEYDAHCAICHGLSGKGDGPFGRQVKFPAGTRPHDAF